tara:strand:- start:152 stop:880 length:729 start_codon:yes stop_codon:yes gene_type:complete
MNIHLVSFGAPFHSFSRAHSRVLQNAENFGAFSSINLFSERDIFNFCPEIIPYKKFLSSTRGYGYWMWKSFLVSRMMELSSDDDLICYADIGCTFNDAGIARFGEYCALTSEYGSLCFDLGHLERAYTKMDTYKKIFPETLDHLNTGQRCATTFLLKNTQDNRNIFEEIKKISVENNHFYITDVPSQEQNHEEFKEHRHDQSVFSLMSKKYKFYCIPDETYWAPNWNVKGKDYPVWATRNKF